MKPLIITSPYSTRHDTGYGHPECAARIEALLSLLDEYEVVASSAIDTDTIALAHNEDYIYKLMDHPTGAIDGDTILSENSFDAALHAVGAGCLGIDSIVNNGVQSVFCATRPPGHHAEPNTTMGFCFFNNIFIAARYAQEQYGVKKIAIVDFDVHHGNGTETMTIKHNQQDNERPIFYISTHASPLFPGTGDPALNSDTLLNIPLNHGCHSDTFRKTYEEQVFPVLKTFNPELLLLSAGFDAHKDDLLGTLELDTDDFGWVTEKLREATSCPTLSMLEGGYHIDALKKSVEIHLKSL